VEFGRHKAFGFEVTDRLTEGDPRYTEFGGQTLLAQRRTLGQLPIEDAATQFIGDLLGQRHTPLCDLRHIGYDIEDGHSFNTIFLAGLATIAYFLSFIFAYLLP
jgi:hypothetical protein